LRGLHRPCARGFCSRERSLRVFRQQPLTLTAAQISPSTSLFSKTYDFHTTEKTDNGNLWAVTDALDALGLNRPNGSVNYNYDAMNRVTSAQTLGTNCAAVNGGTRDWGESFTVDPWGNLTAKTVTKCSAESLVATVSATNQLSAATYDSAGNAYQANGVNFTFDAAGRIIAAAGVTYVYDGSGERVSKTGKLYWRGSGSDTLAETSATDTNPTRYIFFGGKRIARLDPGATTPKYYVEDNVGSTELVTDYLGNPLSESLVFPYRGEQVILANDTNTYKFTGKERDIESGLDNFGARYYASTLGRFMSPDWEAKPTAVPYASFGDPQTLNLYSYVENAPLNRVDADGHVGDSNPYLSNNWYHPPDDWSVYALGAWHAENMGSGWAPYEGHGGGDSNPRSDILANDAANEAEEAMQEAQKQSQSNQPSPTNNNGPTSAVCSEDGPHIVRDAAVTALSKLNPGQDETKNITPSDGNFAKVADPSKVDTKTWTDAASAHGTSKQSPTIPGQSTFVVKLYADPKRGNIIAVVYPNGTPQHMTGLIPFLMGSTSVNVPAARAYMGCN